MPTPTFIDWDGRPVVRFEGTGKSFAVLGGPVMPWDSTWTAVDDGDVFFTGKVVADLAEFRRSFGAALKAAGPWPGFSAHQAGPAASSS